MDNFKISSSILLFVLTLSLTNANRWNHSRGRHVPRRHHSEENLNPGDTIDMMDSSGVSHTFVVAGQSTILKELKELNRSDAESTVNTGNEASLCSSDSVLNGPLRVR